jgi:hypothetical protein
MENLYRRAGGSANDRRVTAPTRPMSSKRKWGGPANPAAPRGPQVDVRVLVDLVVNSPAVHPRLEILPSLRRPSHARLAHTQRGSHPRSRSPSHRHHDHLSREPRHRVYRAQADRSSKPAALALVRALYRRLKVRGPGLVCPPSRPILSASPQSPRRLGARPASAGLSDF